jgi:separase
MGCSSGNQYSVGEFEPYGTSLDYIIAGSPSVVGNLWDVTGEIFYVAESLLKSFKNNSSNICMNLIKARNECKLSHLNGSAPVIYGMPISYE